MVAKNLLASSTLMKHGCVMLSLYPLPKPTSPAEDRLSKVPVRLNDLSLPATPRTIATAHGERFEAAYG